MNRRPHRTLLPLAALGLMLTPLASALAATHAPATVAHGQLQIPMGADRVTVDFVAPDVVHVHYLPNGKAGTATLVMDPDAPNRALADVKVSDTADAVTLATTAASVHYDRRTGSLRVDAPGHTGLLTQADLASLRKGSLTLQHDAADPLYGIGGYTAFQKESEVDASGLLRTGTQKITAGEQGHAGAPLVWSTAGYAVLVDTVGGQFNLDGGRIQASGSSRKDTDYYLIVGQPKAIFSAVANLSGHSQLFPKWAMGFTNSQWGIDQKELLQIVDTYRAKHIPIDNFTLDFDWKAWGEDWGEFRWNQTKFPDGPDGKLKQMLDQRGIHLTGIMKPRVHVDTVEGRYATAHHFWSPASKVAPDYFSKKPIRELDFDQPAVRSWFFNDHLKHSFDTGMIGWWNDEADDIGSDTQFTNMERSLYDGQRAYSPLRVWSINRNFYLGAQRYAYAMWSGDIATGFASMAGQRARMLSAIDVGAMQWGMDGGGFRDGTPTPENYARWIQFGAFTPIFRVHGELGQKRQPWVYGPVAEKAATAAIRLRYQLIPYIYSYEHQRHLTGVGLVRPLTFDWPNDPKVRNDVASWMFGEGLLVSPVVEQGQTSKTLYLPAGEWTDWFSGKTYHGGQSITVATDAKTWSDIPLFVRAGAIIPTQPAMDYIGEKPLTELTVEAFPSDQRTTFDYYDDNGSTYDYEHGAYFSQTLSIQRTAGGIRLQTGEVDGSYLPATHFYLFKVHGGAASMISDNGKPLPQSYSLDALAASQGQGWATGTDRFGPVTYVKVPTGLPLTLALTIGQSRM